MIVIFKLLFWKYVVCKYFTLYVFKDQLFEIRAWYWNLYEAR